MKVFFLAFVICAASTLMAAENLLINGGFEKTNTDLRGYPYFKEPSSNTLYKAINMIPAGNKGITGWTVDKGNVDWIGEWGTSEGAACLDLNGDRAGAVSQTFATRPGDLYVLTFDLSANPDPTNRYSQLKVTVGDKTQIYDIDRLTYNKGKAITYNDLGCQKQTLRFRATSDQTKLTFESLETTGTQFVGGYFRNGYIYSKPIENSKAVTGLLAGPVVDNAFVRPALDSLQVKAKAVPTSDGSKVWFYESSSNSASIQVEETGN